MTRNDLLFYHVLTLLVAATAAVLENRDWYYYYLLNRSSARRRVHTARVIIDIISLLADTRNIINIMITINNNNNA